MSTKNVKKVIALILSIITLFVCFSVYASNNSLLSQNNFEQEALYLSEEDVFEYLGFTCKETPCRMRSPKRNRLVQMESFSVHLELTIFLILLMENMEECI